MRGGAWNNNDRNARASVRNRNAPDNHNNNVGVRVSSTAQSGDRLSQNSVVYGPRERATVQSMAVAPASPNSGGQKIVGGRGLVALSNAPVRR